MNKGQLVHLVLLMKVHNDDGKCSPKKFPLD